MLEQKQRRVDATAGKQYTDTVRIPDQAVAKKRGEQAQQSNGGWRSNSSRPHSTSISTR
jgi:hypothetical protein